MLGDSLLFIAVIYIVLLVVIADAAQQKGQRGISYFLIGLVFTPLVGVIAVTLAQRDEEELNRRKINSGNYKRCPACNEPVRVKAVKCRYCTVDIVETTGEQ